MIGNITRGQGFGGLVRYLLQGERDQPDPERVAWTATRNLMSEDPELTARIMRATANQNPRDIEKPVWHLSISWHPEDSPSRHQMEEAADRVLYQLGLSEHQTLMVAHRDTDHAHVHIVVNRVHPENLRVWKGWQDMRKVEEALRYLELERGYRPTPGHLARLPDQERPDPTQGLTRGEHQQSRREGQEAWVERMREALRPHFREAESWGELAARIDDHGVYLQKKGRGLVVTDGERQIKASRIDRGSSIHKLESRFEQSFNSWREQVDELTEAVESYEQIQEQRGAIRRELRRWGGEARELEQELKPLAQLQQRQAEELARLRSQLETIYGPAQVEERAQALERYAREHSYRRAAQLLQEHPRSLGRLAGRFTLTGPNGQRKNAQEILHQASRTVVYLGELRREIARHQDRNLRRFWEAQGRPLEAPDSLTQARWRMEEARERMDELLPRVFREEAVDRQLTERLRQARDPEHTARLLQQHPERFAKLRGRNLAGLETPERKAAREHLPELARAVQEHGEARHQLLHLVGHLRSQRLQLARKSWESSRRALHQLPDKLELLERVARATGRLGLNAAVRALAIPGELHQLGRAARQLSSAARGARGQLDRHPAMAALKAGGMGVRVLSYLLPAPQHVAAVQLAVQTLELGARVVERGMGRGR